MTTTFLAEPPAGEKVTQYDRKHCSTYFRLLDAEAGGDDWRAIAIAIFHMDPMREPVGAEAIVRAHVERAKWMSKYGFKQLAGLPESGRPKPIRPLKRQGVFSRYVCYGLFVRRCYDSLYLLQRSRGLSRRLLVLAIRRRSARKLLLPVIVLVLLFLINVSNLVLTRSFDIAVLPVVFGCLAGLVVGSLFSLFAIGRVDRKLAEAKVE